jgi:hypothetical protein
MKNKTVLITEPIEWLEKIMEEGKLGNKILILNNGETFKF